MTEAIGYIAILAVIGLNLLVVLLASRNAALRERAKRAAPNVIELHRYRRARAERGSLVNEVA